MSIDVGVETGAKKVFVWAIDWPGWCRSGKTEDEALERLIAYADRYRVVVAAAGLSLPAPDGIVVSDHVAGGPTTDFGAPGSVADTDRRPMTAADATRDAAILRAVWTALDAVVGDAPAELRKGPRGGGRDRDKAFAHVIGAEQGYAQVMGIRTTNLDPTDPTPVAELRARLLAPIAISSDGSGIAGRKWPPRYATRRIAWHALDHAWEIEDRSDPTG